MPENLPAPAADDAGEFILFQTADGQTRIEVRMAHETVWLSQKAMADLFQTTKQNISQHLQTIYEDGELHPEATVKKYLTVQTEGNREVSRTVDHYNLDAILAVGYRVRSHRGTQFRIWATERLREHLIKGFAMDDVRLKRAGAGNYFEELLLEFIPGVGSFQTSETEHRLSTAGGPAHAGSFEAVFDKMVTGAFNHARCNRKAGCQIFVIWERRLRCPHFSALLAGTSVTACRARASKGSAGNWCARS